MLQDGKYFTVENFRCHDGRSYPFQWEDNWKRIVGLCDAICDAWASYLGIEAKPGLLTVVSGYRSPQHNAELIKKDAARGAHGVASGSQHTIGNAADLRPRAEDGTVHDLHIMILNEHELGGLPTLGGIGIYPESDWVHVDTYVPRDNHLRMWTGV